MLHRLHIWHCLTMPILSLITLGHKVIDNANCADNAFYAGVLRCHLCRQCQLCAWDTVFLKLNFHPVNFHFMHIWHCLWHFLGLKYALIIETFIEIRYDIVFSQILVQYIRHWASIFQVGRKTEKTQCHQISKKVPILNDTF